MSDRYVVFGNPIAHSKSPLIHTAFAQETQQNLKYETYLAELDGFKEAVHTFQKAGGKGGNVTVPFKQEAWDLVDERSNFAERAGAVNTLIMRDDGTLYGDNTDGIGLVCDLVDNNQITLHDKRILILGAGGAVRGVLQPFLEECPKEIFIANRTASKAVALAKDFAELGKVKGGGFSDIQGQFDIVVNGTAASLQGDLPPLPDHCLAPQACCYDMMYSPEATPFMRWAKQQNASVILDGLGMLVEQAAQAFYLWRGVRPSTQSLLSDLRQ